MRKGEINWLLAIGLSIALHAAVLGLLMITVQTKDAETSEVCAENTSAQTDAATAGDVDNKPTTTRTAATNDAEPKTYVVQAGDSWYKIASKHGASLSEIAEANGFTVKTLPALHPGHKIKLP